MSASEGSGRVLNLPGGLDHIPLASRVALLCAGRRVSRCRLGSTLGIRRTGRGETSQVLVISQVLGMSASNKDHTQ